jgi:arylsulfatase A-like enzyme
MPAWMKTYLHQLEEDALRHSTIIIQTSDHGGVNPRSKRYCYDEGLHVPLIIQASGRYQQQFPAPGTRVVSAVSTLASRPPS